MKTCPDAACPFLAKFQERATYGDEVERCSDCGSAVVDAEEVQLSASVAIAGLPVDGGSRLPLARLLATLLPMAAMLGLGLIWLPFVDRDLSSGRSSLFNLPEQSLTLGALGLTPWVAAFVVVELFALVVPAWRRLRDSGPAGRARLLKPTLALGLGLTAVQATLLSNQLMGLHELSGLAHLDQQLWIRAALIAGSLVSLALALLVSRFGMGNGFSVFFGVHALFWLLQDGLGILLELENGIIQRHDVLLTGVLVAAAVALALKLVGLSPGSPGDGLPRPLAGSVPLSLSLFWLLLPGTPFAVDQWEVLGVDNSSLVYVVGDLLFVAALTVALGWLLYRPERVQRAQEALGVCGGDARRALARGLVPALGFSLGVAAVMHATMLVGVAFDALLLVVLLSIGRDLIGEARFRAEEGALAVAWPIQRLYLVEGALAVLERADIPAYPRGLHHRLLGQVFSPWVPVELLVPAADLERARAALASVWPTEGRLR